ncbi:hypothetical protein FACS189430_02370 [Bacteroidia bacterium]|nr:hypothetical protein FACS189430_02370 [Bacteroidia bacterium]
MKNNRYSKYAFLLAFAIWLLPFILRLYIVEIPLIDTNRLAHKELHTPMSEVLQLLSDGNNKGAFILIFTNNIKGCILNIIGGVMLGLGTIINLSYNGFVSADIFMTSYNSGMSIDSILKVTLPHSFELIGFWLSGAIGFFIAWHLIQFMRGKDSITAVFCKKVGVGSLIVVLIILAAAYVEAYISIQTV